MHDIERVLAALLLAGAVAGAAAIPRLLTSPDRPGAVALAPGRGGARTVVNAAVAPPLARAHQTSLGPAIVIPRRLTPPRLDAPAAAAGRAPRPHAPHAAGRPVTVAESPAPPAPAPPAPPVASPPPAAPPPPPASTPSPPPVAHPPLHPHPPARPPAPAPQPPPVVKVVIAKLGHALHPRGRHGRPVQPPEPDAQPAPAGSEPPAEQPRSVPVAAAENDDASGRIQAWHLSVDSAPAPSVSLSLSGTSGGVSLLGSAGS